VGGSYGGGIQLVTAAADCRVDAIVPSLAWHSLATSFDKANTPKAFWLDILSGLTSDDRVDPTFTQARQANDALGQITAGQRSWLAQRGPGALVAHIRAPSLFLQGTVDTVFTLQEAAANYRILKQRGVPTSMLWYCGGHGVCQTAAGNKVLPVAATMAWLDRYVKRHTTVTTGPGFRFVDQMGTTYSAPGYPVPTRSPITATGHGTLPMVATTVAGSVSAAVTSEALPGAVAPIVPLKATNGVTIEVPFGKRSAVVVGAPQLRLTYQGTSAPGGTRPARVFAQLVDESTGLVVGDQITPIEVTLDGRTHTKSVPLEMVAFTGRHRARIALQLFATTLSYAQPQLGGGVDFSRIRLTLPVAADITAR
jgi:ABC-2 type transport system ATP-binding protein